VVFAVGELWIFGRFDFTLATPLALAMAGQADDSRFLVLALKDAASDRIEGSLCPVSPPR